MSAAWLGGNHITLGLYLDPGNSYCTTRFREMVEQSESLCAASSIRRRVVFRIDGGYGTQPQIRFLVATNRLFVAKAATTRPKKWADRVRPDQWQMVAGKEGVRVAEIEAGPYVRAI